MDLRLPIPASALRRMACCALCCGLSVPFCHAALAASVKVHKESRRKESRTIEGMEEAWRQALLTSDADALDKLLADDFIGITSNGTLSDKQQYLHRIVNHVNAFTTIELMDLKVRLKPTSAVAISQVHAVGQLDGHPIDGIFRYTKVYGRDVNGDWRVLNYEATRVSGQRIGDTEMQGGTPLRPPARQ